MIDEDEKQLDSNQNDATSRVEDSTDGGVTAGADATHEAVGLNPPAEDTQGVSIGEELPGSQEVATDGAGDVDYQVLVSTMEQDLQLLKTQLDDRTHQYMRIAADFENFRRRTQKEKEELEQQIKCSTINELLPVVDNFERARSQIKPQTDQEMSIHKSYQSVYKQLVDCLKRVGVAPMRSEGKEFDPNLHEAVMREQTAEHPEGTVIEELVRGYMLGDRVLRHAMVKVAAAPEAVVPSEEGSQG